MFKLYPTTHVLNFTLVARLSALVVQSFSFNTRILLLTYLWETEMVTFFILPKYPCWGLPVGTVSLSYLLKFWLQSVRVMLAPWKNDTEEK